MAMHADYGRTGHLEIVPRSAQNSRADYGRTGHLEILVFAPAPHPVDYGRTGHLESSSTCANNPSH